MSPKGNPSITGALPVCAIILKLLVFGMVPLAADCAQQPLEAKLAPLLKSSCLACHGAGTKTPLDLSRLGYNLSDPATFHTWDRVFTRVQNSEMPPKGIPRPDPAVTAKAMGGLKLALVDANLKARGGQRTPLRRLTRLEYGYTVQDLLHIDEAQGVELAEMLPAEADSGGFDTVAAHQGISPIHVKSYLNAADRALDMALALGPRPETRTFTIDYPQSKSVVYFRNPKVNGGGFNMKLDDAEAIFFDFLSSYITHSQMNGFRVKYPGRYRVTVEAYAYRPSRPNKPLALTLYKGIVPPGATAVLSELLGSVDLDGDTPKTLQATTYLRPGEAVAPNVANFANQYAALAFVGPGKSIKDYQGEGMALKTMTIEGPLLDKWPPECTRQLLKGIEFGIESGEAGQIRLTKAPYAHVIEIVEAFATRAFRRPLVAGEAEQYASLAKPQLNAGRPFLEALREPLRAILAAPAFLYQAGPPGALDAYSLASRLSYFLWRGPPDTELLDVARSGRLRDSAVLARQVEKMLCDVKSERFVNDFAAQAFRLRDLRRTTPDRGLYPDYDDRLGQAMRRETEMFLGELIAKDMGVRNLIGSDFTFVNHRLAEHYGIGGVTGTEMRKVTLPPGSHRGGLLTQASILKLTSNGTTTSPVPRGNFVLTCLLGQPTPPPPPGVGTIEPDTRGATTIREQLTAHRNSAVCGSCHRRIDPPGFALESFDPIGGFRTCYRKSGGTTTYGKYPVALPYGQGPAVDPSGVTPEGDAFQGIDDYKRLMLEKNLDQVARHFVSSLLVYSTGAEIEFADRDAVEQILSKTRDRGYPVRTIIHEVVASDLFRRR